mmetsp:Transcript_12393/g.38158  ORF Transcript_12393/g.38158 Transcript_12393/m.38158 type:complete len:204 (+) Transcript_12393:516-1127(+)
MTTGGFRRNVAAFRSARASRPGAGLSDAARARTRSRFSWKRSRNMWPRSATRTRRRSSWRPTTGRNASEDTRSASASPTSGRGAATSAATIRAASSLRDGGGSTSSAFAGRSARGGGGWRSKSCDICPLRVRRQIRRRASPRISVGRRGARRSVGGSLTPNGRISAEIARRVLATATVVRRGHVAATVERAAYVLYQYSRMSS